jgi:hypothetical protein
MLAEGGAFANPRILPEGEFLSRDNFPVYKGPKPEEKTVDKALILSEKESEAAKVAEALGREIPPPTALAPSISKLRGMGANLFAVKPSVINPKLPVSLDDMTPDTSSVDFVAPSRLQAPVAPERSVQAPARIDESFYNSLFGPYKTSVDIGNKTYGEVPSYQYEAPIRETVLRSGPSPLITQPPLPVPAQLAPNELAVPPVDIRIPTDKTAPLREPLDTKGIDEELKLDQGKAPTRETRAADYAMRIINKGKDLAQKEKKLARIARKDESGKAVAKNIDIVDKLYEANKGRQDRFKATFDEITRTMDGKLREEAHAYLVAKDIIEGDKSKPV